MIEDKMFLIRFNSGDKQVLHQIYEKYKQDMLSLAIGMLVNRHVAEDIVHDIFSRLLTLRKLPLTTRLKIYLTSSTLNGVRNYNKTYHRRHTHCQALHTSKTRTNSEPFEVVSLDEQCQHLEKALCQLSDDQREVILLRQVNQLKFKDIATMQKTSIHTVQGRYRYGLDKLRSLLNGEVHQ